MTDQAAMIVRSKQVYKGREYIVESREYDDQKRPLDYDVYRVNKSGKKGAAIRGAGDVVINVINAHYKEHPRK